MTEQGSTARAVWDPTANNGAGGWVRRPVADDPAAAGPPTTAIPLPPIQAVTPAPVPAPAPVPPPAATPFPPQQQQQPPLPQQAQQAQQPGFAPPPPQPSFGGQQQFQPPQQTFGGQQQFQPPQPPQPSFGGQQQFTNAPGGYNSYQEPEFDYDEDPRRRRTPLLIGAAAVLLLVIGGAVVWAVQNSDSTDGATAKGGGGSAPTAQPSAGSAVGGQGGSPSPSAPASPSASASASASASPSAGPEAQAQAKALDALLSEGESAKAPIGNAVAKVRSCPAKAEVDSAAQVFDTGAQQRDTLLTKLAGLKTDSLPGGDEAVSALKTAWQTSADIDRAYAAWARTVSEKGCGANNQVPGTADLARANDLNPKATQAKQDFAAKWKPIAQSYGLTTRTGDRI
ncbi:hypothetical protein [Kitasatospora setae]|uniref:hypothetical protein n=1 Tax=Kitasatospora setae TaxID=2066 RepID=UPI00052629F0|nr:hypothetical protein [Kitasatospora setae]